MPTISKKILSVYLLSLLFFPGIPAFGAEEEIRLEGVIIDAAVPANSVAVLNGNLLKAGEKIEGYTVAEVLSDSVRIIDASGEEKTIEISAKKMTEPPAASSADGTAVSHENLTPEAEVKPARNPFEEMLALPGKLVGRVWEIRGLRDLAIVNNACVSYYNKKKTFPSDFRELIAENLLAESYESGLKGKYRIYLVRPPDPAQFGVHADPIGGENLKFFYVGTDAIIRESTGKPAGPADEPHEY